MTTDRPARDDLTVTLPRRGAERVALALVQAAERSKSEESDWLIFAAALITQAINAESERRAA